MDFETRHRRGHAAGRARPEDKKPANRRNHGLTATRMARPECAIAMAALISSSG
jgi:hypothetical protein